MEIKALESKFSKKKSEILPVGMETLIFCSFFATSFDSTASGTNAIPAENNNNNYKN